MDADAAEPSDPKLAEQTGCCSNFPGAPAEDFSDAPVVQRDPPITSGSLSSSPGMVASADAVNRHSLQAVSTTRGDSACSSVDVPSSLQTQDVNLQSGAAMLDARTGKVEVDMPSRGGQQDEDDKDRMDAKGDLTHQVDPEKAKDSEGMTETQVRMILEWVDKQIGTQMGDVKTLLDKQMEVVNGMCASVKQHWELVDLRMQKIEEQELLLQKRLDALGARKSRKGS